MTDLVTRLQCLAEDDSGHYPPAAKRLCGEAASALAALPALLAAIKTLPCYGCSVTIGDVSRDARQRSRGCVTCRPARAAVAKAEYGDDWLQRHPNEKGMASNG